ncbi:MAG: TIGR04002 family protein [Lachnospiraceae bacterium]|nr:TIGR04002 family protein [Lachnospiraceae bacterium]MBR7075484.1 TIGR04002 family protein [Lachnospiraceae bacterium]
MISMNDHKLKTLTITGILTALIFVFTAYIHIPSFNGYVHIGDGLLYLAAAILPTPYAMFAGAAGAVLADCLSGYAIWAPASFVIKLLTVLFFSAKGSRIIGKHNLLALIPAALLCLGGYYLYEGLIFGNFISPLYGLFGNLMQAVFSSILFTAAGAAFDKAGIKSRLSII